MTDAKTSRGESRKIDTKLFRQLLGCFPTGVAIITTLDADGRPVGLTCNSFSSVSLEPPLVLFSLRKASSVLREFMECKNFAVNILSQQQDALSGRFATSKIADKFENVSWTPGACGMPLIDDAVVSFECGTFACHEAGDHYVFIGEVRNLRGGSADHALVFYKGSYMTLAESLRTLVVGGKLSDADVDEAYTTLFGTLLRNACERATEADLQAVENAAVAIEQLPDDAALAQRIEGATQFFTALAAAGHSSALMLMVQTLTSILRERMLHVLQVRPRPEMFPLRRQIVQHLRNHDVGGATAAFNELIMRHRSTAVPASSARLSA